MFWPVVGQMDAWGWDGQCTLEIRGWLAGGQAGDRQATGKQNGGCRMVVAAGWQAVSRALP